jgi:hypothetical protein
MAMHQINLGDVGGDGIRLPQSKRDERRCKSSSPHLFLYIEFRTKKYFG